MHKTPTKLEILKFLMQQEMFDVATLVMYFGYTDWGAICRLKRLRKEGLIEPMYPRGRNKGGLHILTNEGYRRVAYLEEKQETKEAGQLRHDELENEVTNLSQKVKELEKKIKQLQQRDDTPTDENGRNRALIVENEELKKQIMLLTMMRRTMPG